MHVVFTYSSFIGKGWETHIEGQRLKADGDGFRMKLSTQEIFGNWARKVQQRNIGVTGRIFTIENVRSRTGRGNVLKLKVNFLPEIITLSKEVRNLRNLGFRVPLPIVNRAHQANQLYPFAIGLIESIRTYERTLEKVITCYIFLFIFTALKLIYDFKEHLWTFCNIITLFF